MATASKSPSSPLVGSLVSPDAMEAKSGCMWCPLLPFSSDFDAHRPSYQRDGDKIIAKEREGHQVQSRCVVEPWTRVKVLFVGEAPGANEDKQGRPFVGGSGGLLRKTIAEVTKLKPEDIGFANIVSCRPPRNRKPNNTEVRSCAPKLLREIKARKPQLVVVLGNTALNFLTGQSGITSFVGKVLACVRPEFPALKVLACLHPAYVLRLDHELDKFVDAIETAGKLIEGNYTELPGPGTYRTLTDLPAVMALFERLASDRQLTATDSETGGTSPFQTKFPRLLCVSFSNKEGEGYTVPVDHAESPFRKGPDRSRLLGGLRKLYSDPKMRWVAQNGKFDQNHFRAVLGVAPFIHEDTLLTHFVLDERKGTHGLDHLAFAYTGMGAYSRPLEDFIKANVEANPNRGGSYANIPGSILFPYASMDADVTLRVRNALRETDEWRNNPRLRALAETFYPQLSDALAEIEWSGACIDSEVVKGLDRDYSAEMKAIDERIQRDKMVRRFLRDRAANEPKKASQLFNPESTQQLGKVLFGYYGLRPSELTDSGFDRAKHRYEKARAEFAARPGKKLKGAPQFRDVIEGMIADKEWDLFSTKADVLHDYERDGNPLCKDLLEFRGVATLHGTFVSPLLAKLDSEGRVHGSFLPHGTVTARLSSKDPNLQNIPNKGGGRVKRSYVSRFGNDGVLVQADYSQIELRIAACLFDEPTMIKAYRNGEDLHTLTAVAISKMSPREFSNLLSVDQKAWRTRAKRVNFGVLYQGGPGALVNTLRKDGVFITFEEASELIRVYFEARPGLKRGMEKLAAQVRRDGYLEAFTGHRRRIPEVFSRDEELVARALRQAGNFPVQCGAAQMTNMAMILVRQEMHRRKFRSLLILTVHDSLVLDCHVDEFQEVSQLVKEIMESLPARSRSVIPGLDWKWLRVPIVADIDVGLDWGSMVELKEAKVGKEKRELNLYRLDVDYLWDAMHERVSA